MFRNKVHIEKIMSRKYSSDELFRKLITIFKFSILLLTFYVFFIVFVRYYLQLNFSKKLVYPIIKSIGLVLVTIILGPLIIKSLNKNMQPKARLIVTLISTLVITVIAILNLQYISSSSHSHVVDLFSDGLLSTVRTIIIVSNIDLVLVVVSLFILIFFSYLILTGVITDLNYFGISRVILIVLLLFGTYLLYLNTELKYFLSPSVFNNQITKSYNAFYDMQLEKNNAKELKKGQKQYDKIFIIQLESLASQHVKQKITPELIKIGEDGVLYKNIQASSTNTIRNLETTLCALPPSLGKTLSKKLDKVQDLNCIPKILKRDGYKTIFLKHSGVNLANTEEFIKMIGFDEVHTIDLFTDDGEPLDWGYSDDIAYKNYFNYLDSLDEEKLFVYMEVGAINHYPFDYHHQINDPDLENLDFEGICNMPDVCISTWLQDKYLGHAYKNYFKPHYFENTALLIFGDNPWPDGEHRGNTMNISNAYEENLMTSMVLLDPKKIYSQDKNVVVEEHYGGLEISRILLNLAGYKTAGYKGENNCIISIQPFTQKKIIFKLYPDKYIVDVYNQKIDHYDLLNDPGELNPLSTDKSFQSLLLDCTQ